MRNSRAINPKDFLDLKSDRERLVFLCKLANLAPSSHNMQPWFFSIGKKSIGLMPNSRLRLKVADPQGREFYTTFGTLIGLLKMIASSYGLKFEWKSGDNLGVEIGRFIFTDLTPRDPDYITLSAIIGRHNSRLPFKLDSLSEVFLNKIQSYVAPSAELKIITDKQTQQKIETLILNSVKEAFADKPFCEELYPWLKNSWFRSEDGLPGYNLGVPFLFSLIFPYLTRQGVTSVKQVEIHKKMLSNCAVYGVICNDEEQDQSWISVGESFIQVAIEAQKSGVSIGVMQAAIENVSDRVRLKEILNTQKLPQMFFRMGYCDLIHTHSPRRPIDKVIVK